MRVLGYAAARLVVGFATVMVAMLVLFSLIHLVPGDAASAALGQLATPEMVAAFRAKLGLDLPVPVQFYHFVRGVFSGDLGRDVFSDVGVAYLVFHELPHTAALVAAGLGWAMLVGIPLGCVSAVHRNGWFDRVTAIVSVGTIAIPSFVVAVYALLLFAVTLRWFPALGAGEPGDPADQLYHLVLPAFALGLSWVGYLARLVRASMLETLLENHIRTARAFGLSPRRIVAGYALRLAILPTVTMLGSGIGRLLSGAVFIEIVFNRPGIGKLVYDAVIARNYPIVQGAVLVTTILFVACTLIADLIIAQLDPRIRDGL